MKHFGFVVGIVNTFFGIFTVSFAIADTTYVSGIINTNTVWTPAGNPYIVIGNVLVESAVTLDIEPGVEIRIDSVKHIMIKGTLNAIGTATDSIIITRNGTARWQRLWFKPASAGRLKYCRIEYANKSAIYNNYASSLVIEYNTITDNSADWGGGIRSDGGSPTITENTITNNSAVAYDGGGIYSYGSATITGNTITGNSADWGGGIRSDGSPTITGNTITDNSANYGGGGILSYYGSPTITGNTITGNSALNGGGIYSYYGSATITGNTITDSSNWNGGGIYSCYGSPTITGNTITGNSTNYGYGGGIYSYYGSPTITGNKITDNSANYGYGGGIWSDGSPTITGNTITHNFALGCGGGIGLAGSATITENTITDNSAADGGGICSSSGSPTIKYNTITDTTASAIYISSDSALIDSNNLYATGYAVYNNSESNINARYNYWGTQSSDTIDMKIWDYYDDSTNGIVHYEPFLTEPVQGVEEKVECKVQTSKLRLEVYPNPFRQKTTIHCEVNKMQNISLEIYDLSGRLIGKTDNGIWNGRDSAGKEVQSGIYFLKAKGYQPVKVVKLK